ncbi:MAG: DUF3598 family protein [Acaryochloridaceae cyanobacterium RL_2_7]|nr:DUF3598 family protein [Acaryochloridaceae cyanobacterium RL_2_7]
MTVQWQGLLKNLGVWKGSFVPFDAFGAQKEGVASDLTLALSEDQQQVSLCLNRYPEQRPVKTIEMSFRYPGPGPQIPFLSQGSFSQGPLQYSSFDRFGAELAMIDGDRRLRVVHHYPNGPVFDGLTLICETRTHEDPSPMLTLESLEGQWLGQAYSFLSGYRDPIEFQTHLSVKVNGDTLTQTLDLGTQMIQTQGKIQHYGVEFSQGQQLMRLLLLPGGGSSLCPVDIKSGTEFFLEAGWLVNATLRLRLIRRYNAKGEWESLTLVTEKKH